MGERWPGFDQDLRLRPDPPEPWAWPLLDHETDRVGDQYVAQIWSWPQRRIDTKGLIKEVGAAVVERFTTISKVMTVRLKPREPAED